RPLLRRDAGPVDPQAEDRIVRLTGRALHFVQRAPGPIEQVGPPALEELALELDQSLVERGRLGDARLERAGAGPAGGPVIILHQVLDGALYVVAEPAAARVAVPEVAPEESDRELLVQILGGVRVLQRLEQVAVDRPRIAAHQPRHRQADLLRRAALGL